MWAELVPPGYLPGLLPPGYYQGKLSLDSVGLCVRGIGHTELYCEYPMTSARLRCREYALSVCLRRCIRVCLHQSLSARGHHSTQYGVLETVAAVSRAGVGTDTWRKPLT